MRALSKRLSPVAEPRRAVPFLAALALAVLGAGPVRGQEGEPANLQQGQALIGEERFGEAAEVLSQVVERQPGNGRAWFFLGYALHLDGELDRALEAHLKAAEFPVGRSTALYNAACVHSLKGNLDEAFALLERSGFSDVQVLQSDGDLANLREDPRYDHLLAELTGGRLGSDVEEEPAEVADGPRAFDFLVGEWDVFVGGEATDRALVERVLTDQALTYETGDSLSLLSYVPTVDEWRWSWVSNVGHHDLLVGGVRDGSIVMRQEVLRDRPGAVGEFHFQSPSSEGFDVAWRVSEDGGESWTTEYEARYERRGTKPVAVAETARAIPASARAANERYAFKLGHWDLAVRCKRPDGTALRGAGTSKAWWCGEGGHIHDELVLHFDDFSDLTATVYRRADPATGEWSVSFERAGDEPSAVSSEVRGERLTETMAGSDASGAYVDAARYVDVTADSYTVRVDREYASGERVEDVWVVKATRIR